MSIMRKYYISKSQEFICFSAFRTIFNFYNIGNSFISLYDIIQNIKISFNGKHLNSIFINYNYIIDWLFWPQTILWLFLLTYLWFINQTSIGFDKKRIVLKYESFFVNRFSKNIDIWQVIKNILYSVESSLNLK